MPYPQPVKCVVWGIENEYENVLNQLKFEELKGNIKVLALVCRSEDRYSSYHDGYRVVTREDLEFIDFDVVIIANEHRYSELKRDCFYLKNRNTKWNGYAIKASVFKLPNFDFALYFNLIKNPVTIVSDDCWGAFVYHQLGLEFTSPFTLTFISGKEYVKVFNDPEYYLKQDLIFLREGDPLLGCPVGTIGQGKRK